MRSTTAIAQLSRTGMVTVNAGYLYLNVDDQYIHQCFAQLADDKFIKPNYFTEKTQFMGAHISLIYPEESAQIKNELVGSSIEFNIVGAFTARILNKPQ